MSPGGARVGQFVRAKGAGSGRSSVKKKEGSDGDGITLRQKEPTSQCRAAPQSSNEGEASFWFPYLYKEPQGRKKGARSLGDRVSAPRPSPLSLSGLRLAVPEGVMLLHPLPNVIHSRLPLPRLFVSGSGGLHLPTRILASDRHLGRNAGAGKLITDTCLFWTNVGHEIPGIGSNVFSRGSSQRHGESQSGPDFTQTPAASRGPNGTWRFERPELDCFLVTLVRPGCAPVSGSKIYSGQVAAWPLTCMFLFF
jgi:hypothetical protein